mgnify:CR=1 FL=1
MFFISIERKLCLSFIIDYVFCYRELTYNFRMHNFFIGIIFFVGLVSIQTLNIDGFSKLSFYFLDLVICISIYFSLNNKVVNIPFLFLNIFFLLFFLIAPISQLSVNSNSLISTSLPCGGYIELPMQ